MIEPQQELCKLMSLKQVSGIVFGFRMDSRESGNPSRNSTSFVKLAYAVGKLSIVLRFLPDPANPHEISVYKKLRKSGNHTE